MKIIIKESQYKFLVEQTTPPTITPPVDTTQTTGVKPLTTPPATGTKPMYGTPEQRAAAKTKREGQRKINFDNYVKGAYIRRDKISGLIEIVNDSQLKSGCSSADKQEADYINGASPKMPDIVYRTLTDGTNVKINLKKYSRYIDQHKNDKDVPRYELYKPSDHPKSDFISGPGFFDSLNPFKERAGCIYSDEDKSGVKK